MGKRIVALFSVLILLFSAVIWRLSWLSRKEDFAPHMLKFYGSMSLAYSAVF